MPEIRELQSSCFILHCFVVWLLSVQDVAARTVYGLWADATNSEQLAILKEPSTAGNARIRAGLVDKLDPLSTLKRSGPGLKGKNIWPPKDIWINKTTGLGQDLSRLVLRAIHYDPRNVILDFTACWMQIQLYTHTLPQIFTLSDWYHVICKVPKNFRGYKISVAFELKNYVIAFTSQDMLTGVHWAETKILLPNKHVDIVSNPLAFVIILGQWIRYRIDCGKKILSKRIGLAVMVIKEEGQLFAGIGVYTICEIFFLAGLSPFLTEADLFDNASRLARFVAAYIAWADKCKLFLPQLVNKAVREWKIVTDESLAQWYLDDLRVFGKDFMVTSRRYVDMVKEYHMQTCNNKPFSAIYDPFEPTYLQDAFSRYPPLAEMTFGKKRWAEFWSARTGESYCRPPVEKEFETFSRETYLRNPYTGDVMTINNDRYPTLYLTENEMKDSQLAVVFFRVDGKEFWTTLTGPPRHRTSTYVVRRDDQRAELYARERVQNEEIHIGPLSYCGTCKTYRRRGNVSKALKQNVKAMTQVTLVCNGDIREGQAHGVKGVVDKLSKRRRDVHSVFDEGTLSNASATLDFIIEERGLASQLARSSPGAYNFAKAWLDCLADKQSLRPLEEKNKKIRQAKEEGPQVEDPFWKNIKWETLDTDHSVRALATIDDKLLLRMAAPLYSVVTMTRYCGIKSIHLRAPTTDTQNQKPRKVPGKKRRSADTQLVLEGIQAIAATVRRRRTASQSQLPAIQPPAKRRLVKTDGDTSRTPVQAMEVEEGNCMEIPMRREETESAAPVLNQSKEEEEEEEETS